MRLLLVGLGLVNSGTVCNEPGFENYRRGGDCVRPPLPVCTDPQAANYLPPGPGVPRRETTRYTRAHLRASALTCTYMRFSARRRVHVARCRITAELPVQPVCMRRRPG